MGEEELEVPPFSLELADYFCVQCGGLTRLPTGLILPKWAYRWCLCSWDEIQLFFRRAQEHFLGLGEAEETTTREKG